MNLNELQNELTRLGVTLWSKDDPEAIRDAMPGQRLYRASLYLPQLQAARLFFTTTLAQVAAPGFGPDYVFVQDALESTGLINELALELDFWVCYAVEAALRVPPAVTTYAGYQAFFINTILHVNNAQYLLNVAAFFVPYPIALSALQRITANFQENIRLACERILADRAVIQLLFVDRFPGLTLTSLKGIISTGSDFHKGGKQVLILTFTTRWYWQGFVPRWTDLMLVYKPTDLELDCLLVGQSVAVNRATGIVNYMVNSLAEIFNAEVTNNPVAGLELLTTYRILPRNRTSTLPAPVAGGAALPIRNAYGYIEHLSDSLAGLPWEEFGFPVGESDYLIFQDTNEAPIIEAFYRQMGQWAALATIFSLGDLHIENIRTTKYLPYIIDLENALNEAFAGIGNTLLLSGAQGGITGEFNAAEDFVQNVRQRPGPVLQFQTVYITKYFQNRLWAMRPGEKVVPVNAFWLLEGLDHGMNTLRAIELAGGFANWFARLNNVLVRVLPVTTQAWKQVRQNVYVEPFAHPGPANLAATIQAVLREQLTGSFAAYQNAPPPVPLPEFVACAWAGTATDLANFDIPVFYHRVGAIDLLDSAGNVIVVPGVITVNDNNQPPLPVVANTNVGRATYYANPPTATDVQPQVAALAGGGFGARAVALQTEAIAVVSPAGAPLGPGVLIPYG